jgi:hypothetical protein
MAQAAQILNAVNWRFQIGDLKYVRKPHVEMLHREICWQ